MQIDTDPHADIPVVYNYGNGEMRSTSVIPYRRVSTKAQARDGVSLEDQKRQLEVFAIANQLQSVGDFTDVGSGLGEEKGSKRANFNAACRLALKNDWDVVVTMPSRFTRTIAVYDTFVARGGRLISTNLGIDATAEEIRSHLQAEIVQHEQRQRLAASGQERARAEGRFPGNPDLVSAREKSLEVRQVNAFQGYDKFEIQLEIALAGGAKTPKAIAAAFNKVGFKAPQGGRWKHGNVRRNLKAIAEMKAVSDLVSAIGTAPVGNDNLEQITSLQDIDDLDLADLDREASTPSGYPLSPDELAKFRTVLEGFSADVDQIEGLMQSAANPTLALKARALLMDWMARERAA
jgi:predicted site-specific integrase-resolvase